MALRGFSASPAAKDSGKSAVVEFLRWVRSHFISVAGSDVLRGQRSYGLAKLALRRDIMAMISS